MTSLRAGHRPFSTGRSEAAADPPAAAFDVGLTLSKAAIWGAAYVSRRGIDAVQDLDIWWLTRQSEPTLFKEIARREEGNCPQVHQTQRPSRARESDLRAAAFSSPSTYLPSPRPTA